MSQSDLGLTVGEDTQSLVNSLAKIRWPTDSSSLEGVDDGRFMKKETFHKQIRTATHNDQFWYSYLKHGKNWCPTFLCTLVAPAVHAGAHYLSVGVDQEAHTRARYYGPLQLPDGSGTSTFIFSLFHFISRISLATWFGWHPFSRIYIFSSYYLTISQVLSSVLILLFWGASIWVALRLRKEFQFGFYVGLSNVMSFVYLILGVLNGGYAKLHSAQNDPSAFRACIAFSSILFVLNVQWIQLPVISLLFLVFQSFPKRM